ncbi:MAG: peptidoglycan-binding domain-containing protein [Desulfuromonadaceae bacterium]
MKTAVVRLIQQSLINEGFKPGTVDGRLGDNSYLAVNAALTKRKAGLPGEWTAWSNPRKTVAYLQLL